eukprot:scpid24484/ scgid17604/ 
MMDCHHRVEICTYVCFFLSLLLTRSQSASLRLRRSDIGTDLLSRVGSTDTDADNVILQSSQLNIRPATNGEEENKRRPLETMRLPRSAPRRPRVKITDLLVKPRVKVSQQHTNYQQKRGRQYLLHRDLDTMPLSEKIRLDLLKGIQLDKVKAKPKPIPLADTFAGSPPKSPAIANPQPKVPTDTGKSKPSDADSQVSFNKPVRLNVLPAAGSVRRRPGADILVKVDMSTIGTGTTDVPGIQDANEDPPAAVAAVGISSPNADPVLPLDPPNHSTGIRHSGATGHVAHSSATGSSGGSDRPSQSQVVIMAGTQDIPGAAAAAGEDVQRLPCVMFPTNPPPAADEPASSNLHDPPSIDHGGPGGDGDTNGGDGDGEDKDANTPAIDIGDDDESAQTGAHDWNPDSTHNTVQNAAAQDDDDDDDS